MKRYKLLAEMIFWIHCAWVLAMALTLPTLIFRPEWALGILAFILATLLSWVAFSGCPLTRWEKHLRKNHDAVNAYEDVFITHYLNKALGTNYTNRFINSIIYPYLGIALAASLVRLV